MLKISCIEQRDITNEHGKKSSIDTPRATNGAHIEVY